MAYIVLRTLRYEQGSTATEWRVATGARLSPASRRVRNADTTLLDTMTDRFNNIIGSPRSGKPRARKATPKEHNLVSKLHRALRGKLLSGPQTHVTPDGTTIPSLNPQRPTARLRTRIQPATITRRAMTVAAAMDWPLRLMVPTSCTARGTSSFGPPLG